MRGGISGIKLESFQESWWAPTIEVEAEEVDTVVDDDDAAATAVAAVILNH